MKVNGYKNLTIATIFAVFLLQTIWLYNSFSLAVANTIHPLDVPDEWEDLCLILLNVNYNRYDYLVPICILLAIALIRMSFRLLRKKGILGENLK